MRLDILGFPDEELRRFRKYIAEPYGMVLVTGPTGSGKTTTLYAALSEIRSPEDKIVTIEDPVEYQLKGITQIPINEKKGLTFARGLRSILRHDPDKIMVGEIRDPETAQIAIQSALTGHLVFTTVHANNVVDVLGRFLNMGVEPYQFVSALNCVLAQRLVRVICTHCKRPVPVTRALLEESGLDPAAMQRQVFYEGAGCIECGGTGYKGRTAICELLDLSDRDSGDDSGTAPDVRDQEGGARGGHAVPPRVRGGTRHAGHYDVARDQQGDVRRMKLPSMLRTPPPAVAVEIAPARVTAVAVAGSGAGARLGAWAVEPLPEGSVVPSLTAPNVVRPAEVAAAVRAALERLGQRPKRIALVIPDAAAKVSLVRFKDVPARPADLDELVKFQIRKAAPFRSRTRRCPYAPGDRSAEGQEFVVVQARRDIVAEYEQACQTAGAVAGVVDLTTFGLAQCALRTTAGLTGDWLLIHGAADGATIAIYRGRHPVFFRRRGADGDGAPGRARPPDGDVLPGPPRRRGVRPNRGRRRVGRGAGEPRVGGHPDAPRRARGTSGAGRRSPGGTRLRRRRPAGVRGNRCVVGRGIAPWHAPIASTCRRARSTTSAPCTPCSLLGAAVVLAVTAFNLWQVYVLSGRNAELQGRLVAGRREDTRAARAGRGDPPLDQRPRARRDGGGGAGGQRSSSSAACSRGPRS